MQGAPGRTLVEAARLLGAEMLVLGSRGDGAMSRLMASQYVLRNPALPGTGRAGSGAVRLSCFSLPHGVAG